MRSLYEELGVDRMAGSAAIRRAYRSRAKRAHPDCGGSVEEFGRLRMALEVLSDPVRRVRYDETGEFEAGVVDNREAELLNLIAGALDEVVAGCAQQGVDPGTVDLVGLLKAAFAERKRRHLAQKGQLAGELSRWEKLGRRFERIGEGENRLLAVARGKVEAIRALVARCDAEVERGDRVVAVLADYRFVAERGVTRSPFGMLSQMGQQNAGRMW